MQQVETAAHTVHYEERWVRRGEHRIYARIHPGGGPPVVLLHGFPDNLRDEGARSQLVPALYEDFALGRAPPSSAWLPVEGR